MASFDETRTKIYILYLIENIKDELDLNTVTEIILFDGAVNYFVYSGCISELIKGGLIEITEKDGREICKLSGVGREVLGAVSEEVVADAKRKLLVSASRLMAFKKSKGRVDTSITPADGGFILTLSIDAQGKRIFSLDMYLDSFDEAENMRKRFEEDPRTLYSASVSILTGRTDLFLK